MKNVVTLVVIFIILAIGAWLLWPESGAVDSQNNGDLTGEENAVIIEGEVTSVAQSAWALFVETESGEEVSLPLNIEKNANVPKPYPELPDTVIVDENGDEGDVSDLESGVQVRIEAIAASEVAEDASEGVFIPLEIEIVEAAGE